MTITDETNAIIDEIRESRRKMSAECGHDPERYVNYLMELTEKYAAQVERFRETRKSTEEPAEAS